MTLNLRKMAPLIAVILALGFISSATAQKQKAPIQPGKPLLWADPGAVEKLDLASGVGGRTGAPKPPFTFLQESLSGSNPKVRVKDANGVEWTAKFGTEVNAETMEIMGLSQYAHILPSEEEARGVILETEPAGGTP